MISSRRLGWSLAIAFVFLTSAFCAIVLLVARWQVDIAREAALADQRRAESLVGVMKALGQFDSAMESLAASPGRPASIDMTRAAESFRSAVEALHPSGESGRPGKFESELSEMAGRILAACEASKADSLNPASDPWPLRMDLSAMSAAAAEAGSILRGAVASEIDKTDAWRRHSLGLYARLQLTTAAFFVAVALFSYTALFLHGHVLRASLRRLRDGVAALASGRVCPVFDRPPDDEVGEVMRAFDDMAARLSEQRSRLERANAELAEKAEQLSSANHHKDRFLANMSHELRTPLSAVMGFADLIMSRPGMPVEKRTRHAEKIAAAAEHLLQLITGLLDVVKIDSGGVCPVLAPVQLDVCAVEVMDMLRPLAERKGLDFVLSAVEAVEIQADVRMMRQILINLVGNAIKYTDAGMVEVAVAMVSDCAVMTIRDTGAGISEEDMKFLFRDFHRGEKGLTAKYDGVGIGLTLSRRLVELHGGRIKVSSRHGEGSEFAVELPLYTQKGRPHGL